MDAYPKMHCYGDNVFTTLGWVREGLDPTTLANSYLVEYCNNEAFFGFTGGVPRPGGFLSNLDSQQLLTFDNLTKVGAYNDNDMLEVCNGGLSFTESRAQFATWVILSSPLILGNNPSAMDAECKQIILNPEVIAVSQDPLVSRGKLVWQWPEAKWPPNDTATHTSSVRSSFVRSDDPAPPMVEGAAIAPCGGNWSSKQQFQYDDKTGLIKLDGTSLCLTYGGYGFAPCTPSCIRYGQNHL